jgi:hypothetical protein
VQVPVVVAAAVVVAVAAEATDSRLDKWNGQRQVNPRHDQPNNSAQDYLELALGAWASRMMALGSAKSARMSLTTALATSGATILRVPRH